MRPASSATSRAPPIAWAALLGLAALGGGCREATAQVVQPMDFDHKVHLEADVECTTCHEQAGDKPLAAFPRLRACIKCHKDPQGEHPDEPKVRAYAEKKEEIPWVRVNRYEGHVYFSHAAHVTFGEVECKTCHLGIEQATDSLVAPNVHLDMAGCMRCHDEKGAANECVTCHK